MQRWGRQIGLLLLLLLTCTTAGAQNPGGAVAFTVHEF